MLAWLRSSVSRFKIYIVGLKRPDNLNDLTDLLSKTLIAGMSAIVALSVAAISHHQKIAADKLAAIETGQENQRAAFNRQQDQAQKAFYRQLDLIGSSLDQNSDKRGNISLFLQVLPQSAADPLWTIKSQSLSAYCQEEFKGIPVDQHPPLLTLLCQTNAARSIQFAAGTGVESVEDALAAVRSGNLSEYVNSAAGQAQVSALAGAEANGLKPATGNWYAVIASLPIADTPSSVVEALAKSLNGKIGQIVATCDVHIYETSISKSYAITSGGQKPEKVAKDRVSLIRSSGLISDAFAQPDKGWTLSAAAQPRQSAHSPCS